MKTINRTAITIIPKKNCMEWVNSFDDGPGDDSELVWEWYGG